ncbi:MAG: orotate phosphoribosyltransferase [Clostridia bacterium]|jgi:orotate phosphoribosyltransferase|uniref:orotate phosphoribosyltransferase n=1 Tax=Pumilibacter muris TaxID=2941510 RepID=UPI00203E6D30|nr:orotate phosphoribosyltransferase [Pumilibacter muris]MCI8595860.1 orotate phosphoribosyltransferase [Clostridia bacterium]
MKLTNEQILEVFKKTEGILHGHFLLTSGRHSDTYMQCAKLFVHPEESAYLCGALSEQLKEFKADAVVSPAVGGIIMGYEVARQLGVKNFFAEREGGGMTLRRGFALEKGMRVIVVEDVVTTGGSVKEVIELCRAAGAEVTAVASVVDRSGGKVDFGVPYRALLSMEVKSYEADECPLCREGKIPVVKPGSRGLK